MGSTSREEARGSSVSNHSHVCGINYFCGILNRCICESFPRMWDQLVAAVHKDDLIRIIPTYVGSTQPVKPFCLDPSNHSHVCGINSLFLKYPVIITESFPRMWDQRERRTMAQTLFRIIPTYVGSTCTNALSASCSSNHSHVCGINSSFTFLIFLTAESFPRMWDQPTFYADTQSLNRIIPTYVGSTIIYLPFKIRLTNHSHVCGINVARRSRQIASVESFPRMWDQRRLRLIAPFPYRIIPTYVGSTRIFSISLLERANHSHVCGINPYK